MAGKKKKPAGKGKAAPKKAKAKAKVVAKAKTAAKGKAKAAPKKKPAKPAPKMQAKAKAKPTAAAKAKSAAKAAKPAAAAKTKPSAGGGALLQTEILAMARQVYGDLSDDKLLALDPNSIDEMDPSTFYEMIQEKYGIEGDPSNQNFAGFGGPIRKLIEFVGARWDGKTRRDAPMPPQEWLDEFVHPATERVPSQAEPQDEPLLD
jgi:hypothetical protein